MQPRTERLQWLTPTRPLSTPCAACGNSVGNEIFLRVPEHAHVIKGNGTVDVGRCGTCASLWFPDTVIDDWYPPASPIELTEDFWVVIDHYVELVGGLDWKVGLAERLPRTSGSRLLEVGCNVGLLLDFVRRAWAVDAVGLEPSAYGLAGARRLRLRIDPHHMADMLDANPLAFDVVISTEVIEHVDDPYAFLLELRQLVRPGGIVLLTTPNSQGVGPERAPGELYSMLSVGAHKFVLSAEQLRALATAAGFGHVSIIKDPTTLIAVFADEPIQLAAPADPRPALLTYHDGRIADPELANDSPRWRLADLMAGYLLARELNVEDQLVGEHEIDRLLCAQFGVDVLDLVPLIDDVQRTSNLIEFGRLAPFTLAAYLFYRGHRDDISNQQRTEMWEAAISIIGHGVTIDPVNLFLLPRTLDATLTALSGRPSGRLNAAAQAALAAAPELSDRSLQRIGHSFAKRLLKAARTRFFGP